MFLVLFNKFYRNCLKKDLIFLTSNVINTKYYLEVYFNILEHKKFLKNQIIKNVKLLKQLKRKKNKKADKYS